MSVRGDAKFNEKLMPTWLQKTSNNGAKNARIPDFDICGRLGRELFFDVFFYWQKVGPKSQTSAKKGAPAQRDWTFGTARRNKPPQDEEGI